MTCPQSRFLRTIRLTRIDVLDRADRKPAPSADNRQRRKIRQGHLPHRVLVSYSLFGQRDPRKAERPVAEACDNGDDIIRTE